MRIRSAPGPLILAAALSAAVPVSAVSAARAHPARSPVRIAARAVARQARAASRSEREARSHGGDRLRCGLGGQGQSR
jgi:hypothetical protein